MSWTVIALSLGSAALFGFSPVFSKRGLEQQGTYIEASLLSVSVTLVLYILLAGSLVEEPLSLLEHPTAVGIFLVGGMVGSAIGRLATFEGEHRVGASITSTVLGTTPVFAGVFGYLGLGESLSPMILLGIGVLVCGVGLLSIARGGNRGGWQRRDLLVPLLAAFTFAGGNVFRRFGFLEYPVELLPALVLNEAGAIFFILVYAYVKRRTVPLRFPGDTLGLFGLSALLYTAAMLCLFGALMQGRVAVVESLVSTSPLFATLFVYSFLDDLERITPGIFAGAILVTGGAILVSLG